MEIRARVASRPEWHEAVVETNGNRRSLSIPPSTVGPGSGVNGGELLFLSLATCYCNDIYREAASRDLRIASVVVEVAGHFGGPGDPARDVTYAVRVESAEDTKLIGELLVATDSVAEVHNSMRQRIPVTLSTVEVVNPQERDTP